MRREIDPQDLQNRVEVALTLLIGAGETFTGFTVTDELRRAAPGDSIPHYGDEDSILNNTRKGVNRRVHEFMEQFMVSNPGTWERYTSDELSAPEYAEHYRKVVTPAINVPQVVWTGQ